MSPLRTRMIEDMQLAGLSATTQEVYLQAVTALVKHYRNRSTLALNALGLWFPNQTKANKT